MDGATQDVLVGLERLMRVGRFGDVLEFVDTLLRDGRDAPDVRAGMLAMAAGAAVAIGEPERALAYAEKRLAFAATSELLERARATLGVCPPLLALGRFDEAQARVTACRAALIGSGDPGDRGALAAVEGGLARAAGDPTAEAEHEAAALAAGYAGGSRGAILHHMGLADLSPQEGEGVAVTLAHRVAAALLAFVARSHVLSAALDRLNGHVGRVEGARDLLPADIAALDETLGAAVGLKPSELAGQVAVPGSPAPADALKEILGRGESAAPAPPAELPQPVIDTVRNVVADMATMPVKKGFDAQLRRAWAATRGTLAQYAPGGAAELDDVARAACEPYAGLRERLGL